MQTILKYESKDCSWVRKRRHGKTSGKNKNLLRFLELSSSYFFSSFNLWIGRSLPRNIGFRGLFILAVEEGLVQE
jgi:hypothetical protein